MAQPRILMVLTSNDRLGFGGGPTGMWLDGFATPFYTFEAAGLSAEIATIKGGAPAIDPRGLADGGLTDAARRAQADARVQAAFAEAPALRRVQTGAYDALFLPAGRGAHWDFTACPELTVAVEQFVLKGRPVAAVGHGVAALTPVMDPRAGQPLTRGRLIACPADSEEAAEGMAGAAPYALEAKLRALGARVENGPDFAPRVKVDGLLVTGQNAASSAEAAEALIELLRAARAAA